MSNPTFKPSEGKREEFRKYLEKNGVIDALTKVLVNLYEEPDKPEDALEYIRDRLALQSGIETYAQMKSKLEELQGKIDQLQQELEEVKLSNEPAAGGEEAEVPAEDLQVGGEELPEDGLAAEEAPKDEPQPE